MSRLVIALWLLVALFAPAAAADERTEKALARSREVIGREIPSLTFTDVEGHRVALSDLRGRPMLLALVYTGCADVCPLVIENLAPAVDAAEQALGAGSFVVITIGFDARNDTPARMRSFARQHNAGGANWRFMSGDAATIARLSDAVGFSIFPTAGGFNHPAQITVIDKRGNIYRQIYGSTFEPPQIVEPLKDLVFGREQPFLSWEGISDRIKLFCTVYDPSTGRYYFNYSLFASVGIGLVSLALVLFALVKETRKAMRSRKV